MMVSVPFIGWLRPHNMSDANIDWLMGRKRWHLIGQEWLLHHCTVVGMHFPVYRKKEKRE